MPLYGGYDYYCPTTYFLGISHKNSCPYLTLIKYIECDPTASLSVLKFLEVMKRCCSSDDFICRSFTFKYETDFTSILSQYLCKMADLIMKSGDI